MLSYRRSVVELLRHRAKAFTLASASALLCVVAGGAAQANYVGPSFLSVPSTHGHWTGADHKGWMRADGNAWAGRMPVINSGGFTLAGNKMWFGGPNAPKPDTGARELDLAVDKNNPDLSWYMSMCAKKTVVPVVNYAESSERARPGMEKGMRPADIPEYWEYKLLDVTITDCPVVAGAAQQAFKVKFQNIAWTNWDPARPMANKITLTPEQIAAVRPVYPTATEKVKSFLVTWIAHATTTTDADCPVRAPKRENRGTGKPQDPLERFRLVAGTVPDPKTLPEPVGNIADGLNLDGDDGTGAPPPGIKKHKNFTAPDGRTGIDNQLYLVEGCGSEGSGRLLYFNQTNNARRADGNVTTIVQISGIKDEMNDPDVQVAFIHSMDHPIRDDSGKVFIPDASFRPTDDPNFVSYNWRVHGHIKDGVVYTDVIPVLHVDSGQSDVVTVYKARLRFAPKPDGSVQGLIGGYEDWRVKAGSPAQYYALKRNADGLKDPVTGEYDGISAAWDIDTVTAYMVPVSTKTASTTP